MRKNLVLLFILLVLFPGYFYVGYSLRFPILGWILLAIPFLLIASLPFRFKREEESSHSSLDQILFHGTFLSMGVLTYLFLFTLLQDLAEIYFKNEIQSAWVLGLTFIAVVAGTLRASMGLTVKQIRIPLENLPAELNGLKIAQISDLHVGPTIRSRYVENVVRKANQENPDIVALTGDIADGRLRDLKEQISPLKNLKSQLGVFYVPGNHEFYWNINDWTGHMKSLGAQVLWNTGVQISWKGKDILVGGITDPVATHYGQQHKPDPRAAIQSGPNADLKILLSHRPGFAKEAAELGFDLQLSGHTHGGQFFPWTLVVRMVHEFFLGLHRCGKMWIYVNAGTGSWGPLLRLGTTPELTVLELISTKESIT